jgi:hypothetical protein
MRDDRFTEWNSLLARDPGGRGVAGDPGLRDRLGPHALREAAESLGRSRGTIAIVTGFYIFNAPRPAAETDGPPGALFLARVLRELGRQVVLISDAHGLPLLDVGCKFLRLDVELVEFPFEEGRPQELPRASHAPECNGRTQAWIDAWLATKVAADLSHLIAIERVGPSHTSESVARQSPGDSEAPALFELETPPEHRDACHNMRGDIITGHTAKTHLLFEACAERRPDVATLGLADGGNELGMGAWPWRELKSAIRTGPGGHIACRTPVRHPLLAGVSNWAAYALAAALAANEDRQDLVLLAEVDREQRLIERMVEHAGAVDGVSRESRPTVDGLSQADYANAMAQILAVAEVVSKS